MNGDWRIGSAAPGILLLTFALSGRPADSRSPVVGGPHRPDHLVRLDPRATRGYDWPQFGMDSRHAGNNIFETRIDPSNVSSLRKLFRVPITDVVDGAPAYLARVPTGQGMRDLLFATSAAGFVIAHDGCTGERLWRVGPPQGAHWTTSSPAVDPDRQFVYSYQTDGYVHKFRTGDGAEATGGGWPQLVTRKPDVEKGSSPITIAASRDGRRFLYMPTAGYPGDPGDEGDYQGHVTAIDLATGQQTVFNALCSDRAIHFDASLTPASDCAHVRSGIWARSGVVYDSATDRVLFTTGNGDFDGNLGGRNWGSSVLSVAPDLSAPGGLPADSYTPADYQSLSDQDLDLGSSGPLLLPRSTAAGMPPLAVQVGKDGRLRIIDLSDMSGQGGPGHIGGERQILAVPQGGEVLTALAAWSDPADGSVRVFVTDDQGLSALHLDRSQGEGPLLSVDWTVGRGGTSPIIANGILYYAGSGFVAALDPRTGQELWSDHEIGQIHWQSPIVVNGVLYLTDNTPSLVAYAPDGIAPPRPDGPCH